MIEVGWALVVGTVAGLTLLAIARVLAAVAFDKQLRRDIRLATVEEMPGPYDTLIRLPDGTRYRGSCTVWYEYPSCVRASTYLETLLNERWQRAQWERDTEEDEGQP